MAGTSGGVLFFLGLELQWHRERESVCESDVAKKKRRGPQMGNVVAQCITHRKWFLSSFEVWDRTYPMNLMITFYRTIRMENGIPTLIYLHDGDYPQT